MTATARPRLRDGAVVSDSLLWSLRECCRRLGMTPARGIRMLCQREGVDDLGDLAHERAAELLPELRRFGEDGPMPAATWRLLAAAAERLAANGEQEEAERLRRALAVDGQGPTYPV